METSGNNSAGEASFFSRRAFVVFIAGVVALGVLAFAAHQYTGKSEVIARVGAEEITREDANIRERQLLVRASQGRLSIPEAALFDRAVDHLITESLLYQDAVRQGFSADPEEVEARYNATRDNFESEEAFLSRMEENLLTPRKFRENIARQIVLFAYLEELKRLEAQAELDAALAQQTSDGVELEVSVERTQLTQGEIDSISERRAEELRSEFAVEVYLD